MKGHELRKHRSAPQPSVLEGASYATGDPNSPVAICTLSSFDLLQDLAGSPVASRAAILGPLETENIGIERLLTTLLEQPRIRWLIVCGDERRGPYQGQALRCLFSNGIGPEGQIPGARSRRARLRTLGGEHVETARRQVSLHDLAGVRDVVTISAAVSACIANDPGPFHERVSLPELEPITVPARPHRLSQHDPNGFFVILVDRPGGRLLVEHYSVDGALVHRIVGPDAESLCAALVEWNLVSLLDHAAYLGRELAKAEFALRGGLPYRQDERL